MQNAAAMSTASWISVSQAPAARAAATSDAVTCLPLCCTFAAIASRALSFGEMGALSKSLIKVENRQQVEDGAYAIVGSPATVRDKLLEYGKRLGVGNLLGLFQLGTLPADLTRKNMQLFAREVMPALQAVKHAQLPGPAPVAA